MSPPHRRNSQAASSEESLDGGGENPQNGPWACNTPKGCLFNDGSNQVRKYIWLEDRSGHKLRNFSIDIQEHILLTVEDLSDAVRMICSNEACPKSPYIHGACFESFEESVLKVMRSCPRAKSWSDKQCVQNLWTKRGYELIFKTCECPCGHGHVRKDLDWIPPPDDHQGGAPEVGGACGDVAAADLNNGNGVVVKRKRKKSSKNGNPKPNTITIGLPMFNSNGLQQQQQQHLAASSPPGMGHPHHNHQVR